MLKKVIIALTMCFAFVTMGYANPSSVANTDSINAEVVEVVEVCEDESEVMTDQATDKLTQAEKVENLKKNDPHGITITIMAMVIVVLALVVLFLLFLAFGKMSSKSQKSKKIAAKGCVSGGSEDVDSGEVIAAISMALAQHFDSNHDTEDTVLTIKRMKRAYSPWNSKIYNMREIPQVNKK